MEYHPGRFEYVLPGLGNRAGGHRDLCLYGDSDVDRIKGLRKQAGS